MKRHLALLLLFALSASLWAVPEPTPDEVEAARQRYEQWRHHPDKLGRLRQNWQSFLALPAERREQVLQLDHDLHDESLSAQTRLWNVLERYTDWYVHLPEPARQALQSAPDKASRLVLIREMRDRDWMKRQPRALREQWAKLQGKAHVDFVAQLRQEERQRHFEWQMASRFWKELEYNKQLPARLDTMPLEVQRYVRDILQPMLEPAEQESLKKAEGNWPAYPLTLVELADRHPPALPGPNGPRRIEELPEDLRNRISKMKDKLVHKSLDRARGRWPDFALAVLELTRTKNRLPLQHELWPQDYYDLLPPMQKFVKETLPSVLSSDELRQLVSCEKRWPDYPQLVQKLAQAHHLQPPWHSVPEVPSASWDPALYRLQRDQGYPEVAAVKLRQFALYELDPADRARLHLSPMDPSSGHRLKEAYFKHRQEELKKLRQQDARKSPKAAVNQSE
jgi:hypothetical protein